MPMYKELKKKIFGRGTNIEKNCPNKDNLKLMQTLLYTIHLKFGDVKKIDI